MIKKVDPEDLKRNFDNKKDRYDLQAISRKINYYRSIYGSIYGDRWR